MNKRSLSLVLAAITTLCLAACDLTTTGGAGGGGGAGGETSTGTKSTGTTGTTGTGGTGGSGCDTTYTCADAIDQTTGDPSKICPGSTSATYYKALRDCFCGTSVCATECADTCSSGAKRSATCQTCFEKASTNGGACVSQFTACSNDI